MDHQRRKGASGVTRRQTGSAAGRARALRFANRRRRFLITRFLLAIGIITALVMAAYKPARGAPTDAEKCTAAKISATGKYAPGACPASIGAARIENCWSNSAFTFDCN
jgi:hypothetical protein